LFIEERKRGRERTVLMSFQVNPLVEF
jgi:hypothetical protein